ncbi:hypothetical protein AB6A40_009631 [Gnathostoma spinigerum]|uniref:Laminin G domain-containing protein n=1 Tax=Gnathostoma spinigerum TaxID=75299 RepID=A0ABD6F105_9BILA
MTFEPLKVVGSEETIRISVQFRPAIENGLIFGLMTNKDPEKYRITVSLTDGKLTFELVYVKIRRDLKHVLKTDVCDGRWHNITLHISPQIVFLELDSVKERLPTKASSVEAIDLFRSLPINVGGVSARTAEKISATSLVGCYRNLRLANTKVSLSRAKRINKVVPNMCPFMN